MNQFILDASVAAKWFFDEPLKEEAVQLNDQLERGEIKAIVPEFFYLELANTFRKKVLQRIVEIGDALEGFDNVLKLPLQKYSDQELCDVALENALRFKISVYDGIYLALAEVYVAPFITADRMLFDTCKKRFDFIEFLGDVKV